MKFRRAQENAALKKVLREEIDELIQLEASNEDIIDQCRERMRTTTLSDVDITVMVRYSNYWVVGVFVKLLFCIIVVEVYNGLSGVE